MLGPLFAIQEEEKDFLADRHKKLGIECVACHGEGAPAAPASGKACLACHKSLEAVAEKTKDYTLNPHDNHMTQSSNLECTQCHNGHKPTTPACHQCHQGMIFNG